MSEIMCTLGGMPVYYDFSIGTPSDKKKQKFRTMKCVNCGTEVKEMYGFYLCFNCDSICFQDGYHVSIHSDEWLEAIK